MAVNRGILLTGSANARYLDAGAFFARQTEIRIRTWDRVGDERCRQDFLWLAGGAQRQRLRRLRRRRHEAGLPGDRRGRRSRAADPRGRQGREFQGRPAHGAGYPRALRSRCVAADRRWRGARQRQPAAGFRDARRICFRQNRGRDQGRSGSRGAGGIVGQRGGRGFRARPPAARLQVRQVQDAQERKRRGERRRAGIRRRRRPCRCGPRRRARAFRRRRGRRDRPRPGQRAAERAVSNGIRRSGPGAGDNSASRLRFSTKRRWPSSA